MSLSTADPGSSKNLLHQAWFADLSLCWLLPTRTYYTRLPSAEGWGEETEVSAHLQLAVLHALQKSTQSMLCATNLSGLRRVSSSRLVWAL